MCYLQNDVTCAHMWPRWCNVCMYKYIYSIYIYVCVWYRVHLYKQCDIMRVQLWTSWHNVYTYMVRMTYLYKGHCVYRYKQYDVMWRYRHIWTEWIMWTYMTRLVSCVHIMDTVLSCVYTYGQHDVMSVDMDSDIRYVQTVTSLPACVSVMLPVVTNCDYLKPRSHFLNLRKFGKSAPMTNDCVNRN